MMDVRGQVAGGKLVQVKDGEQSRKDWVEETIGAAGIEVDVDSIILSWGKSCSSPSGRSIGLKSSRQSVVNEGKDVGVRRLPDEP